ncbi:hypothetical protein IF655_05735 [Streptomyces sp. DSM 110735]|uniref:hypothetical protein n=1 Tax=Streptomyces sp. DSM 110735 TaxID=2775031 RepID=UPI0018F28809|nr:hypothetical protein [Streptomyces sp. DSM 110735]MBJ7902796.1 hypothetical protein [Streptomyces sp. DSM 110735]
MTPASEVLMAICRARTPGVRFPSWTVTTHSGYLVGLTSEIPSVHDPWSLEQAVRGQALAALLEAGLVELGAEEAVPEYVGLGLVFGGSRAAWRRLSVTEAGRTAAGPALGPTSLMPSYGTARRWLDEEVAGAGLDFRHCCVFR